MAGEYIDWSIDIISQLNVLSIHNMYVCIIMKYMAMSYLTSMSLKLYISYALISS